jgi:uncharacterized protein YutE (UPF0331/DUF86 family)
MIDSELVTRKIVLIMRDLKALEAIAAKSEPDYLASTTDELVVERLLERVIGRMIDLNYHLLTEVGEAPPSDYFESFTRLAPIGALPSGLAQRIAACAGLRNRIVHEYDELDPRKVYAALQAAVRDVPEYLRLVHAFANRA